jgi:hypothetical protein
MSRASLQVTEVWFVQALPEYGVAYIGNGAAWSDTKVTADRELREIVIRSAKHGTTRVPFENVRQYKAGGLAKADE